jgi:hypothetical protein
MSRFLSQIGLLLYILLAAAALIWWAPNFFSVNVSIWPQANYRYITATGIPLGMLLVTVAARQSIMQRFSVNMLVQVLLASLAFQLGIMTFQFLPQSVFFCAVHLAVCAVTIPWNLFKYRRDLQAYEKRRAAMAA